MRSIAADVARSVVCMSVCLLGTRLSWTDPDAVWRLTHVGSRNHVLDGVQTPHENDTFKDTWAGPLQRTIAHCSPAAAGECTCPAYAAVK